MRTVVAGHICIDLIPALAGTPTIPTTDIFKPGSVISACGMDISLGGAVGNTGVAMAILGTPATLMAAIGCDYLGDQVVRMLRAHNAAPAIRRLSDTRTSYSIVLAPSGRDRTFIHDSGANDTFGVNDVNWEVVAEAALFHFGYPPVMRRMYADAGNELTNMFRRAKALGVTTCLDFCVPDPNGPAGTVDWQSLIRRVTPHVDILAPSLDDLLVMFDPAGQNMMSGTTYSFERILQTLRGFSDTLLAWGHG